MSIKLLDVIKNYKGLPHQKQAIEALERLLGSYGLSADAEPALSWRATPGMPRGSTCSAE